MLEFFQWMTGDPENCLTVWVTVGVIGCFTALVADRLAKARLFQVVWNANRTNTASSTGGGVLVATEKEATVTTMDSKPVELELD